MPIGLHRMYRRSAVPHFDALQRTILTRSMLFHDRRKRLQCAVNRQGGALRSWRASFGFFWRSSLLWSRSVSCWRAFADLGSIKNQLIVLAVARRCLCVGFRSLSLLRCGANGCVHTVATGWISGGGMCPARWSSSGKRAATRPVRLALLNRFTVAPKFT